MKLDEALSVRINLVPNDDLYKNIKKDYAAMQGMLLGDTPKFSDIIAQVAEFEKRINNE